MTRTDRASWPEVLTRADVALVWGVSVATVDRMRERGELPARLPGGSPLWSKSDVVAWLDRPSTRRGFRRVA